MKYLAYARKVAAVLVTGGMFAAAYHGMVTVMFATKSGQALGTGIMFSVLTICLFCLAVTLWWEAPKGTGPVS